MQRTLRHDLWWLGLGAAGTVVALLLATGWIPTAVSVRWTGVWLLAALGGVTAAVIGPRLLPLAQVAAAEAVALGRRLRPLTQGAALGFVMSGVAFLAVTTFPEVLSPIHVQIGRGIPDLLLDQLLWVVPAAGVAGATLGLVGWIAVRQRQAAAAGLRLIRAGGHTLWIAWVAAAVTAFAALYGGVTLIRGAAGGGSVADRADAILAAGVTWPLTWIAWGLASVALLSVLILLTETVHSRWRPYALSLASVAIAADLVGIAIHAVALPATARAGDLGLFEVFERIALAASGSAGNAIYGGVGLALVIAGRRRLHPLLRLVGITTFVAVLVDAVVLSVAPQLSGPVVLVSVTGFIVFSVGLGWQLAVSRRQQSADNSLVRHATRALLPLHPWPGRGLFTDAAAVEFSIDPEAVEGLVPGRPAVIDGKARIFAVGAYVSRARLWPLPAWMGLRRVPMVTLRVPVVDDDRGQAVALLRGWTDASLRSALVNGVTGFELAAVGLSIRSSTREWAAVSEAGSVHMQLREADGAGDRHRAPAFSTPLDADLVLARRGGQTAAITVDLGDPAPRPLVIESVRIPYLEQLGAQPIAAARLADGEHAIGRARWR